MNELELKTFTLDKAKIEFNKNAIMAILNETLKKYENLVFTEDNTKEIRLTLAELRKGKKYADEFRKETKKAASENIVAFEKDMKEITKQFDDVIDPINEQLKEYEQNRKDEKRLLIEEEIEKAIHKHELRLDFSEELQIDESMLAKSKSMKEISDSIDFLAKNLKERQKNHDMQAQMIRMEIEKNNKEHDLEFTSAPYINQLQFMDYEEILDYIKKDVKDYLDIKAKEKEQTEEKERLEFKETQEPEDVYIEQEEFDDLPFEPQPNETEEIIVFANDTNKQKIIDFLEANEIDYSLSLDLPF